MPGIKHATKKRLAKASTSKKSLENGISAEYTEYRTKLVRIVSAIKSLLKQIQATAHIWAAVAKHQTSFSNALFQALPVEGMVRNHSKEVEATVRRLQSMISDEESTTSPHKKISAVLESYLRLVESVQTDYPGVDMSYTEVVRYQRKVDKLQKKGNKKQTILQRNIDKLSTARLEHEQKLSAVLKRMKNAYDKHEAIFQCAHHAFWLAQEKYSEIINDTTRGIRWESMAVREVLMKIDVNNSNHLLPVQRVQMLMPPAPTSVVSSRPLIEQAGMTAGPQSTVVIVPSSPVGETMVHVEQSDPNEGAPSVTSATTNGDRDCSSSTTSPKVVHLTPERPSVSVALKGADIDTVRRINSHGDVVYVPAPAPPTERAQLPKPAARQLSTNATEPAPVAV